ncbi:MAG: Metalloprotease MmpA [Candidatus Dependentiae bacterium ADurb.Bin331]|nr:MAG: Metalloprotease MmpA [Candidatus Dependentiae bacterium ADurb.Bin331]
MNASFNKATAILITLLALSFIIFFHELGHFLTCQIFKVPTPTFSIGFGPALVKYKTNATTFQLALLPLGGYVSIAVDILNQKPYWQKMIITLAGIFNNVVLSFILFFIVFICNRRPLTSRIAAVAPNSPAEHAGLKKDDKIVMYNDHSIEQDIEPFTQFLQTAAGKEIILTVQRDNEVIHKTIKIEVQHFAGNQIGYAGFLFETNQKKQFSIAQSAKKTLLFMKTLILDFGGLFSPASKKNKAKIIGPVGIISITGKTFAQGWTTFLFWVALLSMQIGLFNLLPLPLLDGGQATQFTAQALIGRPLSAQETAIMNYALIMLCIILILATSKKKRAAH